MLGLTRKFLMAVEIFCYQKMIKNEALSLKMKKKNNANCYKKGIVRVRLRMNHDALEILCLNALRASILRFSTLMTDQFPPNLQQLAKKALPAMVYI